MLGCVQLQRTTVWSMDMLNLQVWPGPAYYPNHLATPSDP
jgi:hypothetical protein